MVALGNNRNNGWSLGAFNLNANNGLGNSNGNNWRSRSTTPKAGNKSIFSPSELSRSHARYTTQSAAGSAVKDLHTSAVSRTVRRFEDCGRERWERAA